MIYPIRVIQRPHKFCFSKNPVQYQFHVIFFDAPDIFVQVQIYMRDIGDAGDGALVYAETIKPQDYTVTYNLQDIAEASLQYAMPNFAGAAVQPGTGIKEFYIKYRIIYNAHPDGFWYSEKDNFRYIIKGGIADPLWDWNNYFINYYATNKPFLTWQPANRFIGLNDEFFISWLNVNAAVPLSLIASVTFTDGSTATVTVALGDSGQKRLYHFKAGPDHLGLNAIDVTKKLYKYSLKVVAAADITNVFAADYTYYIDYRKFYYTKFFHYFNSLGGLDPVRIRGEIEFDTNATFSEAEKYAGDIIPGSPNAEEYTQTSKSKFESFKGDVGNLHTSAEQDILQELLLTRFAWERIANKNLRIYVTNGATKLRSTADKTWAFPITWRYSFNNSVFTPALLELGAGADAEEYPLPTDACPVPTGLSVTQNVIGFLFITNNHFIFTAPYVVQIEIKQASSGTWVVEGIEVNSGFSKTYPNGSGTYNWRIKTICDYVFGFESAYTNGPDFTC